MSSVSDGLRRQAEPFITKVKTLLNSDLKSICKEEGLQVSGVKATLQGRVIERLNDAIESGDSARFYEMARRINRFGSNAIPSPSPQSQNPPRHASNSAATQSQYSGWSPSQQQFPSAISPGVSQQSSQYVQKMFKASPFYTIKEPVTGIVSLPVMNSQRHTSQASFRLTQSQIDHLSMDRSLRLMLYCFVDHDSPPRNITFPTQVEIRVNQEPFQGNLRGIKKKPGTTKPADIHGLVRRQASYVNTVALFYAATDRKHSFVVCIVKTTTVDELVERVRKGHFITKQSVVNEMVSKAKDEDIVATSTVMSLKCPLSATRMVLPCRSTICNHNQCFDANSFLLLQEQAPQWNCPICGKTFRFEDLVVDQFVQDILNSVSTNTEQITIEPNGSWRQGVQTNDEFRVPSSTSTKRKQPIEAWDVDAPSPIEQASAPRVNGIRAESISTPQSAARTPTVSSREPSASAPTTAPRSSGQKRSAEEVIDLTLSDDEDEDEEPRRPPKRPFTGNNSTPTLPSSVTPNLHNRQSNSHQQNHQNHHLHQSHQRHVNHQTHQSHQNHLQHQYLPSNQNQSYYPNVAQQNAFPPQNFQARPSPSQSHQPISIPLPPKPSPTSPYSSGFGDAYGGYGNWQ